MSKSVFELNREIESFVLSRADQGFPIARNSEELAYINQYAGYGGLWKFDENLPKDRGLYEYYTDVNIITKMVGIAHRYGYDPKKDSVLEPSCGVGRFLNYFPPAANVVAYEPDRTSYLIAKTNFPSFEIINSTFNEKFVDRRGNKIPFKAQFNLVIGNPPYGEFSGRYTITEKRITMANTYVDYFIARGLDVLISGGLLIYIIPSAYIDGGETKAKKQIHKTGELLGAFRLPRAAFKQTDIQTDIIVYRKK